MPLLPQCVLGAVIITVIELLTGLFLNVYLGLNVWDYSNQPFNFMGQICPQFCIIWCILSILVIRIDDWLKEKVLKRCRRCIKIFNNDDFYYFFANMEEETRSLFRLLL